MKNPLLAALMAATLLGPPGLVSCASSPALLVEARTADLDPIAFQYLIKELAEKCPLAYDVRVEVKLLEGVWGRTSMSGVGTILIELDARQPMQQLVDTLIHEWGHAMVWGVEHEDHGPLWGVATAKAYRVSLGAARAFYGGEADHPR